MTMTNCPKCGNDLPQQEGAGRPARYCSDACKRAAGYEMTRLNRRLQGIEDRLSMEREEYAVKVATQTKYWVENYGASFQCRIDAIQEELNLAEKRLLDLCSGSA